MALLETSEIQNRKELGLDWELNENTGIWQGSTKLNPIIFKHLWDYFLTYYAFLKSSSSNEAT